MIVGVDVGGTFTDAVSWDGRRLRAAKMPTTEDQSDGVIAAATDVGDGAERLLHGTTVATNALLERRGARLALVTDPGFEDVVEIGRQDRPSLYDPFAQRAEPLVDRAHRGPAIDRDLVADVDAAAVCLLRSYLDRSGEDALREQLRSLRPDLPVALSADVAPEFREFERTSTTVLNAYLLPRIARYLEHLGAAVSRHGAAGEVSVMRSSGGLIGVEEAARLPASILLSGPAGGAVAAGALGTAMGLARVISFDMGGTSTDVCRVESGRPEVAYERAVDGYACRMPSVAIHTVGAGGGSIGWIDSGGSLRVGPHSAGAMPGPACYRRGGSEATVTDANVVLGRIAPAAALGGRLPIDGDAARAAVGALAGGLGLDATAGALGIVAIVEEVMAGAVRTVSIEQGTDPRDAWLVAFGGAGGLHASSLARALDMSGVIVPPHAGVLSALGLLLSPPRVDRARSVLIRGEDGARLDAEVGAIADAGLAALPGATVTTICDVRYLGQSHELSVPYQLGEGWSVLADRFHQAHLDRNGFHRTGDPIELTTVRAEAVAAPPLTVDELPEWRPSEDRPLPGRVVVTAAGPVDAEVVWREGLAPGDEVTGPAIVEERNATTYVAVGERAVVDESGSLVVTW